MKRIFCFLGACVTLCSSATVATAQQIDTLQIHSIEEVAVVTTRASQHSPFAHTNIEGDLLQEQNYGGDLPHLLRMQPSVVATSESGCGIGGSSLRIRGTDATRINVTMNGVPMNDAETHSVYWYDTPDVASATGSIQIQRGVGTSTNGTGAFGASLNMTSAPLQTQFGGSASLSYGSYNTRKEAIALSSGLLGGHWAIDARLSHIGSDGYVERASSDLKSYMVQVGYYHGRTMVKALSFGGTARVYLAYSGIDAEQLRTNRRYNPEGEIIGALHNASGDHITDEDGNTVYGVIGYYDDHTDNYLQINNQVVVSHIFDERWSLSATAHYTYGDGYYKNYKNDQSLAKYGLAPIVVGEQSISRSNVIRKKSMFNHFGGIVGSANYKSHNLTLAMGVAANIYDGAHFGDLLSIVAVPSASAIEYYRNNTTKYDANIFAKADWRITPSLNLFADVQYRHITHTIGGVNDNFDEVTGALQRLDIDRQYNFVNPKIGLTYSPSAQHDIYASFAVAQKEPTRNNFTDIREGEYPTSETLLDAEAGYRYSGRIVDLSLGLYYMYYIDQLVLTGELSDTGELLSRNTPRSYRRGVELMASVRPLSWLTIGANATFSQNHILGYVDHIDGVAFERGTTTIAYSPSIVAGTHIDLHIGGFQALLQSRYVSRQYLTNGNYDDLALDGYCITDLDLSYTVSTKRIKSLRFGLALNNLFNTEYCSNGYGGSWLEGKTLAERGSWACYFPQATFNILGNITLKF